MITLKLTTAAGTRSTMIGDSYATYDGVSWRNSVDNCDTNGAGRVYLECDDQDAADFVAEKLDVDADIVSYQQV